MIVSNVLVLFTSQAADNRFLPDVLGIKAERWAETAADSWDKHCLGFFACNFYLYTWIYLFKTIVWQHVVKNKGLISQAVRERQSVYFRILKLITYTCCEQAAVRFCELYCSCLCSMRFPQSALLNLQGQSPLTKKSETRVMILHHKETIQPNHEQDQSCIKHGLRRCLGPCLEFHIFRVRMVSVLTVRF